MDKRLRTLALVSVAIFFVAGVAALAFYRPYRNTTTAIQTITGEVVAAQKEEEPVIHYEDLAKIFVTKLASDEFEGRNAGFPGNDLAAKYIADHFAAAGLKPYGDIQDEPPRSYFQRFTFNASPIVSGPKTTQNVIGIIEGTDLKDEIVVIGAHYDHVGKRGEGEHYGRLGDKSEDLIFNGADDNASGTSAIMLIAYVLGTNMKENNWKPRRTIMFIAFSAEEAGLCGSEYFVNHPTMGKISDYVFMLNLDMIGRNGDRPVQVKGTGTAVGDTLHGIVKNSCGELNAIISPNVHLSGGDSDHSSFGKAEIPFVFFFTGFHPDYHQVTDTADKIDYINLTRIAKASFNIITIIADMDKRLVFAKD